MALRVYILGDAAAYQNYALAVKRAGGIPCFGSRPADCYCLLLPGGWDMELPLMWTLRWQKWRD